MGQANSRQEAFWDACGFGRTHLVKKFIEEGIDINWNGWTALHNAAYWAHLPIVERLITSGASVGMANKSEDKSSLGRIARLLITAGSDVDALSSDFGERGETAADRAQDQKMKEYLMNAINQQQQEDASLDRTSISSSQSFIAQTAHDTAVAIEKITAQSKSSASASSFVPVTMPPLAIATSEERKKNIKLGIRRQTSAGSASGPTSPGWSPGSAPHVELASDNMGDIPGNDRSIQLLRSFQDRLNRRIEKASKTLQGGLFRPEGTDPVITPSSSEASTREQTPASTAEGTSSSRERTPSSREATPSSREVTPSQGSESVGASGNESEEGEKATCNGQENVGVQNGAVNSDSDREGNNVIGEGGVGSLGSDMNACHLSEKQATEEKDSSSVKSEKSVHSNHSSLPPESSAAVNGSEKVVAPPESETTV
nr:hypothetical protein BaRGS_025367 [Batillaria attramentaria]